MNCSDPGSPHAGYRQSALGMTALPFNEPGAFGGVDDPARSIAAVRMLLAPALAFDSDAVVELLIVPHFGQSVAYHYRADEPEKIVADAAVLARGHAGVFITLDPLPSRLDRPSIPEDFPNRLWFSLNFNGTADQWGYRSASWAERCRVEIAAGGIVSSLRNRHGWPEPVMLDTGNGQCALWRVGFSKTNPELCESLLREVRVAIRDHFETKHVTIGELPASCETLPARIRLPWSRACKGPGPTIHRPWMTAKIIRQPESLECVPVSLLLKIADRRWNELPERDEVDGGKAVSA